jgi:acyl-CoA thioesterase FadM
VNNPTPYAGVVEPVPVYFDDLDAMGVVTYERPLTTVGAVDLAFWVETLGRTSAKFGFRFQTGENVHAYGQRTIVKIDPSTLRPAAWTEPIRRLVTAELLVSGAIEPSS